MKVKVEPRILGKEKEWGRPPECEGWACEKWGDWPASLPSSPNLLRQSSALSGAEVGVGVGVGGGGGGARLVTEWRAQT